MTSQVFPPLPLQDVAQFIATVPLPEQLVATAHPQASQFDPEAWDHWLLLAVVGTVSLWTLRTSWQWRQDWKRTRR